MGPQRAPPELQLPRFVDGRLLFGQHHNAKSAWTVAGKTSLLGALLALSVMGCRDDFGHVNVRNDSPSRLVVVVEQPETGSRIVSTLPAGVSGLAWSGTSADELLVEIRDHDCKLLAQFPARGNLWVEVDASGAVVGGAAPIGDDWPTELLRLEAAPGCSA